MGSLYSYLGLSNGLSGLLIGGGYLYLLAHDQLSQPIEWIAFWSTVTGAILDFGAIILLLYGMKRRLTFCHLYQSYLIYAVLELMVLSLQFGCLLVLLENRFGREGINIRVYMVVSYILMTLIECKIINCLIYFGIFGYQKLRQESNYFRV